MRIVSWMSLHPRVDVHSGTRNHNLSLQTQSCYPLSYRYTKLTSPKRTKPMS
ncbi:unnamed protein product [Schistosoma margrebowiei]|uniref:Uncharacterized protein n=1 Tax=Schistosoma margrebowiei TaxID=48269 RepID=A0A3P8EUY3_9TREM|nr:unnamed protein product [Schistosoma margrebowiei]